MMARAVKLVAGIELYLTSMRVILLGTGSDGLLDQGLMRPREWQRSLLPDGQSRDYCGSGKGIRR